MRTGKAEPYTHHEHTQHLPAAPQLQGPQLKAPNPWLVAACSRCCACSWRGFRGAEGTAGSAGLCLEQEPGWEAGRRRALGLWHQLQGRQRLQEAD